MKKLFTKLLSAMLAMTIIVTGVTSLAGCKVKNDPNTIYVSIINKGYGTEWANTLMDKFLKSDAKYANYKYEIIPNKNDEATKTTVESGEKHCNYDLVFHGGESDLISSEYLVDLTPVYEMAYKDGKLKDYMDQNVVSSFERTDGAGNTYYNSIPYVSAGSGLIVNYELVTAKLGANWEQNYPCRTTEEFMVFLKALRDANVIPFVMVTNRNFYGALYETWWAQFEGMNGVKDFYSARYYNELEERYEESYEAFLQPGILQSLKVMEDIFQNEANYKNPVYTDWSAMQAAFMEGFSAMIVNGSWMYNEMTNKLNYKGIDMRFIKTPVISALGYELGLSTGSKASGSELADVNYTITDESKFIEVIDYVDGKTTTKPAGVSDAVIERVREARSIVWGTVDNANTSIPSYSIKKDVALDFVKWMYSEEGHKEYVLATQGLFLPVENDILANNPSIQLNSFTKTFNDFVTGSTLLFPNRQWKYSKSSLVLVAASKKSPAIEYLITGKSGLKENGVELNTAYRIYEYNRTFYGNATNWNQLQNEVR